MAYILWFIIPAAIPVKNLIVVYILNMALFQQNSTVVQMTSLVFLVMRIIIPFALPILVSNIVEKAELDPSAESITKITKMPWIIAFVLTNFASVAISVYHMINQNFNYIWISQTANFIFFTFNSTILMLIVNLVCNDLIEYVSTLENIQEVDILIEKSITAVKKLQRVQKGFSPFLFFLLPYMFTYCIFYTYFICDVLLKNPERVEGLIPMIPFTISCLVFLYYIFSFCDDSCLALSSISNKLRWD